MLLVDGCQSIFSITPSYSINYKSNKPDLHHLAHLLLGGKGYTWIQGMTLEELIENKDEILANSKKRKEQLAKKKDNRSTQDI
jgi:hypothetical protein